ncbi:MAG: alanine racemase [Phycisphaerae bacterium]|nr:alanine racemase [Phycisphaerae bacterium]
MTHEYLRAEISTSAIRENLRRLRQCTEPGVKFCPAVKCNAYGHGLEPVLRALTGQADALAVATPAEALELRRLGYDGPVLLFLPAAANDDARDVPALLEELLRRNIILTVTRPEQVQAVRAVAARLGVEAPVHVKVDTGMTRSGAPVEQAASLVQAVRATAPVRLAGIYTHLACADEADKTSARDQLALFEKVLAECDIRPGDGVVRHAANSAGLIDLPESHYDMVRPGISLYGYQPGEEMHNRPPLRPCLRLVGPLMQIRRVSPGTRCGYGLTHKFTQPGVAGLVSIGYGDGYFRALGNRGVMRIGQRDVPIRGRVSMDQTIIDLTDVPDVHVGQAVEIISANPRAGNSVESLARLVGTIPHEITTRLGDRVERILVS